MLHPANSRFEDFAGTHIDSFDGEIQKVLSIINTGMSIIAQRGRMTSLIPTNFLDLRACHSPFPEQDHP